MVLGKLPVPGRPTNLDKSRARASCACSSCGWGLFGHFFSRLSFLSSFSLSLGDGLIWTEILSQRAVKPKTANQPTKLNNIFVFCSLELKKEWSIEIPERTKTPRGGRVVRWCFVNFQCRGVLQF